MPRKIGELELDFEIPTWNSNWDFEEITVKFTVDLLLILLLIILPKKLNEKTNKKN